MSFKKSKSIEKAIEAPAIIIPVSEVIARILDAQGIPIEKELVYPLAIALYGIIRGAINWIKHRKKK